MTKDEEVIEFCAEARSVDDASKHFGLSLNTIRPILLSLCKRSLFRSYSVPLKRGGIKKVYVSSAGKSGFIADYNSVYSTESLPAHDPFGIAKRRAQAGVNKNG